jgi:membrane protein YdbS with pleckstrin-like domain
VAFQEEQLIARVRQSWWRLLPAMLALFLAAAIFSYVNNRVVEQWLIYVAYSIAVVLAVFFWLIPLVRHLNFYVELTTSRLVVRDGLFGQKSVEVSLGDISSVEIGRGRVIAISRRDAEPITIKPIASSKTFVKELRAAAKL